MLYGLDILNDVRSVALNNSLSYSARSSLLLFNQLLYGQRRFSLEISKSTRSYRDVTSEPAALFCLLSPMRKCRHAQLPLIRLPCFPHLPLVPCVCVCVPLLCENKLFLLRCHIHFPIPGVNAPVLGKHDITSQRRKKKRGFEVKVAQWHLKNDAPLFCFTAHSGSSCSLANYPPDNWLCLQPLNHIFIPFFITKWSLVPWCSAVTPTTCAVPPRREVFFCVCATARALPHVLHERNLTPSSSCLFLFLLILVKFLFLALTFKNTWTHVYDRA